MSASRNRLVILLVVILVFILTACQPAATPTATPDVNAIQTEVYSTVQAGMTATAASQPTATVTPTTEPTATATVTPAVTATNTEPSVTITPLVSPSPSFGRLDDKGQWLYNVPDDTSVTPSFAPGETFTVTWRVKNTGTTTWSENYQFRFFLSDPTLRMGASDITLPKEVKPNEEVDLTLTFKAPTKAGEYNTIWVLSNAEGANFLNLNFSLKVGGSAATSTSAPATSAPATATSAPAATNTPEPSPTTEATSETPTSG